MQKIKKVLIANRGEIALRILRTLKAAGIPGVVMYHRVDRGAPAVREAEETYLIEGETPVAAYLDIENILAACRTTGANAVHPGYGFLAENAPFAKALAEADVIFIGPTADVIELMGDKVSARKFVEARGFPVAPSAIEEDDPATFVERVAKVGFPVLIKPAAGGGGKGMRVVYDGANLAEEVERGRREGERYFADGRLFAERFIENPRHIEVQVFGDQHGNYVHFWERECSIQRRFQKIIEETPSPALSPEQRQEICTAAVGIAEAVGYQGAGTVEFIYAPTGEFYFLEMNTRLQVEHPVTEMVTGYDLVYEQLRVAAGEALNYTQADITQTGHSIECRICAEDADADFAPAIGKLLKVREPVGPGIRVDSGVIEGQDVTTAFDPMLSKLIVYARDRQQCITRTQQALRDYVLLGVTTNTAYLDKILSHSDFISGDVHTGFLAEQADVLKQNLSQDTLDFLLSAAALTDEQLCNAVAEIPELYAAMGHWRN